MKLRAQGFELAAALSMASSSKLPLVVRLHALLPSPRSPRGAPGRPRRPPDPATPRRRRADSDRHPSASAPGGDRRQRRRRERRRGHAAFIAETFGDQWAELVHRLPRVRSLRHEHDLVALRSLQRHERRDAARVRRTVAELEFDLALERLGDAAQAPPPAAHAGRSDSEE